MRPNNRQRSRGGRSGGGGGNSTHHHKPQHHGSNRTPNRNQIFDSSGPDVRVRGNAHQVFDKYQSLAREAASSGDRILAEAYYQYADHYYRVIQSMGGFVPRNNWGEGGEDGQQQGQPGQQGPQSGQPQQGQGGPQSGDGDIPSGERAEQGPSEHRPSEQRSSDNRQGDNRQGDSRQSGSPRQNDRRQNDYRENSRDRDRDRDEPEPGLNGVAFLQNGRTAPGSSDPAVEEQPEVPEFVPATGSRRA